VTRHTKKWKNAPKKKLHHSNASAEIKNNNIKSNKYIIKVKWNKTMKINTPQTYAQPPKKWGKSLSAEKKILRNCDGNKMRKFLLKCTL
jgi:hypothetical protein